MLSNYTVKQQKRETHVLQNPSPLYKTYSMLLQMNMKTPKESNHITNPFCFQQNSLCPSFPFVLTKQCS